MKKTIIHIGYPRTGTTWFQTRFFPLVQNYSFLDRNYVRESLIHPSPILFSADDIKGISTKLPVIISEEMILGRIRGGEVNLFYLKEFAERSLKIFHEPEIVIFIRRQQNLIYSLYNLYIRKGGTYGLKQFLKQGSTLQEALLFSKEFLKYDKVIQLLETLFGENKVHIFLYENFESDPKSFIREFTAFFNFTLNEHDLVYSKVHTSYSPIELSLKRGLNHFTSQGIPFKHYFLNIPYLYTLMNSPVHEKAFIGRKHQKILNEFCECYRDSNEYLFHKRGLQDMSKFGYFLA